jgi:uncharacterized membrane protein
VITAVRPGTRRRRNRRIDWIVLRWQARLDAQWADRVLPWVVALVLFIVLLTAALARVDRLGAGAELARASQAAWRLAAGRAPETSVGGDVNFFGVRLPLGFVPLAALTRILPTTLVLLSAQAASLALGVVPLWHLARKVANLRIGAAAALVLAYACHPAVADLDLADFNPMTVAMTPLLVAAYAAERGQWKRFAVASVLTVVWSSELGLVVMAMGIALLADRERRVGIRAAVGGLLWTTVALFAIQAPLGNGLVSPDAFTSYGDSGLEVLLQMLRNPFRPLGDLLVDENVQVLVWILAPLLFLPVLAFRKLAPALPLQVLYLIADVPVVGADGGGRTLPLVAFAFVAAPFALARLGKRSIDRILVDRRLLALLAVGAVAALFTSSALAPAAEAWRRDEPGEDARRAAIAAVPPLVPARVPEAIATELSERRHLELVAPGQRDPEALTEGVDVLVLDESATGLDDHQRFLLRRRVEDEGFTLVHRAGDLDVFVRRDR